MEHCPFAQTAEIAAALRVWHTRIDDPPLIFDDRAAIPLLSPGMRQLAKPPLPFFTMQLRALEGIHPELAALRGQTVTRARFAEDALDAALDRGCRQILILGAGLDTTAIRRPDVVKQATLLEVDHPDTQRWKRARLPPELARSVSFSAVDFARNGLPERLLEARLDPRRPLFAHWLGCTYYLSPETIRTTLDSLAQVVAPGSELVADYWLPSETLGWRPSMLLRGIGLALDTQHQPLLGCVSSATIHALAADSGWQVAEDLDAATIRARWLAGRRDSLSVPAFGHCLRLIRK